MSSVTSQSELTTKEIVEQAIQDYHMSILPYLAKGNNGYSETPIGAMQLFDDDEAPSGWLIADGTVYNIEDYPFLASHIERVHGSKNYYGGNGTTTFAVPNWQGEFFRASGTNAHANQGNGGEVGEHQDATEHLGAGMESNNLGYIASTPSGGAFAEKYDHVFTDGNIRTFNSAGTASNTYKRYTSRPTNTSLLCCIKAVPAGVNYSSEEQEIGTWIDGKPLYQKTINFTTPSVTGQFDIAGISDIETLVNLTGFLHPSNNWDSRINSYQAAESYNFFNFNVNTNRFYFNTNESNFFSCPAYITIQYTKTTD